MRVVVVTPHPVEPATSGDRIRTLHLVSALRSQGVDVKVGGWKWPWSSTEERDSKLAADLVLGRPATKAMRGLTRPVMNLRARRDPFFQFTARFARRVLADGIARLEPDVVDFQHSYTWIPTAFPNVLTLIDVQSHLSGRDGTPTPRTVLKMEERAIASAGDLVALSRQDVERASLVVPGREVHYVPLGYAPADGQRKLVHADRLTSAIYVGSFEYEPNRTAVRELLVQWPEIRARSGLARLVIAGRGASHLAIRPQHDVEVHSDVPDIRKLMRAADVLLVPLTTGGGVRVKVIEAFALGLPVVSTKIGIEGLEAENMLEAVVVEDVAGLAAGAELAAPRATREALAGRALKRWEQTYSPEAMAARMIEIYERVAR